MQWRICWYVGEEGSNIATKKFLITISVELACKWIWFVTEHKDCCKNVLVLKWFESKHPNISCGAGDENESIFVTSNQCFISKRDVYVDNVKVMGQCLIDCFASWSFGDGCVCAERYQEFTGVDKVSLYRSIDDMAVVLEMMTTCILMKFFWLPQQFCVGFVWTINGVNWWKSVAWMM